LEAKLKKIMTIELIFIIVLFFIQVVVLWKIIYIEKILKPAPEIPDDVLLVEAKKVILQAGKASASILQSNLKIGYARAARLLDILEEEGLIGHAEGAKPRDLIKK
jgi:DNA segregation ATPase FtsK/SpoIIIE-like protein